VLSRNEKLGGRMGVVGFRHEGSQEVKNDYKYSDFHSISLAPFSLSQNRNNKHQERTILSLFLKF
jgi:hypothetical protein